MDQSSPWAYFDGTSQKNGPLCGGGALLHLFASHFYKLKMGLGLGSNNYVELMSLKLLIPFAWEQCVNSLQIFGDSMHVVNWTKKIQKCHNVILLPQLEEILGILDSFDSIFVRHIYRERKMAANSLSKASLELEYGNWLIIESKDVDYFEFYHRPF